MDRTPVNADSELSLDRWLDLFTLARRVVLVLVFHLIYRLQSVVILASGTLFSGWTLANRREMSGYVALSFLSVGQHVGTFGA